MSKSISSELGETAPGTPVRGPFHAQVLPAFLARKVRRALPARNGEIQGHELLRWERPFDLSESQQVELREEFIRRSRPRFKELWGLQAGIKVPVYGVDRLSAQDGQLLAKLIQAGSPCENGWLARMTLEQAKKLLHVPLERLLGFLARVEALDWVVPPPQPAAPGPVPPVVPWKEPLTEELRERANQVLKLPWVLAIDGEDARLLFLDLGTKPTDWFAVHLERDMVPGAFRTLVELLEKFDRMTASEEVRTVVEALALTCTPRRSSPEARKRWQDVFLMRVLSRFGAGHTLQEVGDAHGVTRERVRQMCDRFEDACREASVCTPALDRVLAGVARVAPVEVTYAERQFARFIGEAAGLESLLGWTAILGRRAPVAASRAHASQRGIPIEVTVLQKVDEAPWVGSMIRHIRRDQHMLGCTNVLRIAGLLAINEQIFPGQEAIETLLEASTDFRWLDKYSGWFTLGDSSRCAAAVRVRKVVSVAQDTIGMDEIVGALASDDVWIYREEKTLGLAMPPVHVFRELCKSWPWIQIVQRGRLAPQPLANLSELLSATERVAVAVIGEHDGVACRFEISERVQADTGASDMMVSTTLGSSPVIDRIEHGLYAVRGRRMGDQALAKARGRGNSRFNRPGAGFVGELSAGEFLARISEASLRHEQYSVPVSFQRTLNGRSFEVLDTQGERTGECWVTPSGILKGLNRLFLQAKPGDFYRLKSAGDGRLQVVLVSRPVGHEGDADAP